MRWTGTTFSSLSGYLLCHVILLNESRHCFQGEEFEVDKGHFCPAIATAVKTMQKEEEVRLVVKPECECHIFHICLEIFL